MRKDAQFKHYCGIKRDQPDGDKGIIRKQTISVANRCLFLPMSTQAEMENQFTIGTGYEVWFKDPEQDVVTGDQLVWNTRIFNVRAARVFDVPRIGHVYVVATLEDK